MKPTRYTNAFSRARVLSRSQLRGVGQVTPPARVLEPREFEWGELDGRLEAAAFGLNHMEAIGAY